MLKTDLGSETVLRRTAEFVRGGVDRKKRTATLSFSSEEPVERDFGSEVLSHDPGSVRLDRLNQSAPVLSEHDPAKQVGVVVRAWVDEAKKVGRAVVRFAKTQLADEILDMIEDGIRLGASVGYRVHDMRQDERGGQFVSVATDWEPLELSSCALGADPTIGFGRSIHTMTEKAQTTADTGIKTERDRVRSIQATCEHFKDTRDVAEMATRAISDGTPAQAFNDSVLELLGSRQTHIETRNFGNFNTYGQRDLKNYSFCRAILGAADGKLDGLEGEMHQEYCRTHNTSTSGVFVPPEVLMYRSLTAIGSTSGDEFVEETVFPEFVDMLKKKTLALNLGARMLTGLQGEVKIPAKTSAGTASWETEIAEVAQTDMATAQISLVPKRLASSSSFSRLLMIQSTPTVEQLVRDDITSEFAIALDAAIFEGASGGPDGVTDDASGSVSIASAGSPTYAECLNFEQDIADANADIEGANLAWVTTPGVRNNMRQTVLDTGSGRFLWDESNRVVGYPAHVSNNVATNRIIYGNWREVVVGQWGGLELIVDNLTSARKALINITGSLFVDVDLRHDASFSINV